MEGFILSPQKKALLERVLAREARRPIIGIGGRSQEPFPSPAATEIYVAYTPESGIPGLDVNDTGTALDDVPGMAECDIYKFKNYDPDGTGTELEENWYLVPAGFKKRVFNVGTGTIDGGQWVPVAKEKFGQWLATAIPVSATASDLIVEEVDGVPHITGVDTIQIDQNTMKLEMPAPGVARIFSLANGIDVVDDHSGTTYSNVTTLTFLSDPSTYDPTKGDYVFSVIDPGTGSGATGMNLGIRLNGKTGTMSPVFTCIDGDFFHRDEQFINGLWKTESALYNPNA